VRLVDEIVMGLTQSLKKNKAAEAKQVVEKTRIGSLVEYSRAIHAEMEAILSVARNVKGPLRGTSLYVTTFPCHNCARHVVASGIHEVYFIEPYPKSLAIDLHSDSISLDDRDRDKAAVFLQFEGVSPKNILKLFGHGKEKKIKGSVITFDHSTATPLFQPFLDSFTLYEDKIVADLEKNENQV